MGKPTADPRSLLKGVPLPPDPQFPKLSFLVTPGYHPSKKNSTMHLNMSTPSLLNCKMHV